MFFQLRKAIEDVNSGNLSPQTVAASADSTTGLTQVGVTPPLTPISPVSEPLLMQLQQSDKKVNNTITSMDSALSNSDNCSDIELDNIQK